MSFCLLHLRLHPNWLCWCLQIIYCWYQIKEYENYSVLDPFLAAGLFQCHLKTLILCFQGVWKEISDMKRVNVTKFTVYAWEKTSNEKLVNQRRTLDTIRYLRLSVSRKYASSLIFTLHKKWSFPLRIFSVNVTKSEGNCEFGHIYWRNLKWKTSFSVQC